MSGRPAFHLFGFPIHVRPGFVMFMVLIIAVNGGELGVWLAGSAASLTLLHELGHGFAARATGARAEISLDFLAGYASFVPVRPLKRWERAGISVAGPAVQIGISLSALILMGVNPLDPDSFRRSAAALAIWWTGPVMGLFNLLPVLPLDGGHIVQAGLDKVLPGRSREVMLWFSVVVTVTLVVYLFLHPRYRSVAFFATFPLVFQLQMLSQRSRPSQPVRRPSRPGVADAEAEAWTTGDLQRFGERYLPSPWYRAHQQLAEGHPDVAAQVIVADFTDVGEPAWWPPDFAPPARLAQLVDLLPRPLPTGRVYDEHVLANILLRIGRFDDAARYAAASFGRTPSTTAATVVARAAGALGDRDTAIGWLRAALDVDTDPAGLTITMDAAPELAELRDDPRFTQLRQLAET
jgi:Zn-dependent protease